MFNFFFFAFNLSSDISSSFEIDSNYSKYFKLGFKILYYLLPGYEIFGLPVIAKLCCLYCKILKIIQVDNKNAHNFFKLSNCLKHSATFQVYNYFIYI